MLRNWPVSIPVNSNDLCLLICKRSRAKSFLLLKQALSQSEQAGRSEQAEASSRVITRRRRQGTTGAGMT